MLMLLPVKILRSPELVEPSARMFFEVVIFAARLVKSLAAVIAIDPALIEELSNRDEDMLPLDLAES